MLQSTLFSEYDDMLVGTSLAIVKTAFGRSQEVGRVYIYLQHPGGIEPKHPPSPHCPR